MLKGILFLLKLYYKYSKRSLVYLFVYTIMYALLPLASIVFPKFIIDELMGGQRVPVLIGQVILFLLIVLFGGTGTQFFQTKFFLKGLDVAKQFQIQLNYLMYEADLQNIESPEYLSLKNKAERFINADGNGFGGVLRKASTIVSNALTLVGLISIISYLNIFVLLIFVILVLITSLFQSRVKKANISLDLERPEQERKLAYDSALFSEMKYAKEIRINSMGKWLVRRFGERYNILNSFYKKMEYNSLKLQMFTNVVSFIQQGIAYGYLIYSVIEGYFGIGSFTMYLNAVNSFSGSMMSLMEGVVDLLRFGDYYTAVADYMDVPKRQREQGLHLPISIKVPPEIEFCHVSFRYPGQDKDVLHDINIKITPGEKLSIVGENGAGKTTFIKLILRLYQPTEGNILLNKRNIQDYDFDEYVQIFSAVFQDYALFSMSLRQNIVLHDDNEEDKKIREIMISNGLGEKLELLENGLDTQIYKNFDESGFEPSGGEGQKIALSRAVYKDTPVVILDEPTAALDPRAEYEIYQNFHILVQGKTAVYISHRLSSAKFCDKIAVFRQGRIVEYGTHLELYQRKGLYYELFELQAKFYLEEENNEQSCTQTDLSGIT